MKASHLNQSAELVLDCINCNERCPVSAQGGDHPITPLSLELFC